MENNPHFYFSSFICQICTILNSEQQVISQLFPKNELCITDCRKEGGETERVIELDLGEFTLTCLFNTNHICDAAVLWLHKPANVSSYIEYLNQQYPYSYLHYNWALPACHASVKESSEGVAFVFVPRKIYQ